MPPLGSRCDKPSLVDGAVGLPGHGKAPVPGDNAWQTAGQRCRWQESLSSESAARTSGGQERSSQFRLALVACHLHGKLNCIAGLFLNAGIAPVSWRRSRALFYYYDFSCGRAWRGGGLYCGFSVRRLADANPLSGYHAGSVSDVFLSLSLTARYLSFCRSHG